MRPFLLGSSTPCGCRQLSGQMPGGIWPGLWSKGCSLQGASFQKELCHQLMSVPVCLHGEGHSGLLSWTSAQLNTTSMPQKRGKTAFQLQSQKGRQQKLHCQAVKQHELHWPSEVGPPSFARQQHRFLCASSTSTWNVLAMPSTPWTPSTQHCFDSMDL